jgi:hypothetical protein
MMTTQEPVGPCLSSPAPSARPTAAKALRSRRVCFCTSSSSKPALCVRRRHARAISAGQHALGIPSPPEPSSTALRPPCPRQFHAVGPVCVCMSRSQKQVRLWSNGRHPGLQEAPTTFSAVGTVARAVGKTALHGAGVGSPPHIPNPPRPLWVRQILEGLRLVTSPFQHAAFVQALPRMELAIAGRSAHAMHLDPLSGFLSKILRLCLHACHDVHS